jgi:hypothetical protein
VRRSCRKTQRQLPCRLHSRHVSTIPALPAAGLLEGSEIHRCRREDEVKLHAIGQPQSPVPAVPSGVSHCDHGAFPVHPSRAPEW